MQEKRGHNMILYSTGLDGMTVQKFKVDDDSTFVWRNDVRPYTIIDFWDTCYKKETDAWEAVLDEISDKFQSAAHIAERLRQDLYSAEESYAKAKKREQENKEA